MSSAFGSSETKRGVAFATALLAAVLALPACVAQPEAHTCASGIYCPAGSKCAARQAICIMDNCGDGMLQQGEACDDGNRIDGDGCSADCKSNETCGNGIIDEAAGEVCDDRNTVSGDGCSADCKSREGCGNGSVEPDEECDTGGETPVCNANCKWARHGDGFVNASAREQCDGDGAGQGNGKDCQWTGCNSNCTISKHGDGFVNTLDAELCDGDGAGGGNGHDCESATCNANCTPSSRGDGIVNTSAGEQCDGGHLTDCQSANCNANCTWSRHGDGIVNPLDGEKCDGDGAGQGNGKTCEWAGCNYDCTISKHGDGIVNPLDGEKCDGGNVTDCESPDCNRDCTWSRCGDKIVNQAAGEQCDDGNAIDEDDCLTTCKNNVCGDRIVNKGTEACDLGAQRIGGRNGVTECPYGPTTCQLCDTDCNLILPAVPHSCGDFTRDVDVVDVDGTLHTEGCDNATSLYSCGSCGAPGTAAACTWLTWIGHPLPQATGTIAVVYVADLLEQGVTFTLNDGTNDSTFRFIAGGSSATTGDIVVTNADGSAYLEDTAVAQNIASTIKSISPYDATASGTTVTVHNFSSGIDGNQPVTVFPDGSTALTVTDLHGGLGCPKGQGCVDGRDCVSGNCSPSTHKCSQ
jgi:cysteine-rich repeat protein